MLGQSQFLTECVSDNQTFEKLNHELSWLYSNEIACIRFYCEISSSTGLPRFLDDTHMYDFFSSLMQTYVLGKEVLEGGGRGA